MHSSTGPVPARSFTKLRSEMAVALRFVAVGLANTVLGYAFILGWMLAGLGDYGANVAGFAMGLPVSYVMHRRLTYRASTPMSPAEMARYALAFMLAYGANLLMLAAGRWLRAEMGYAPDDALARALIQGIAIVTYAGVLFILTRFMVFASRRG